jgi:hypothetical protein
MLSTQQAFDAMSEYIWRFAERAGDDLATLLGDTGRLPNGQLGDPAAWDDWIECVRHIQGGNEPRGGNWV